MSYALTLSAAGTGSPAAGAKAVPSRLRARLAVIAALSMITLLAAFSAYRFFAHVVQTIGRDSVPSIVAAEKIRTTLADAHTQVINLFLAGEGADGPSMQAYRESMAQAHDYLLDAGQNITYGDDERKPILAVMTELAEYERLVGQALNFKGYSDALGKADALMRDRILPAVVALDQANFRHLDAAYHAEKMQSHLWLGGLLLAAALLAAAMVETQRMLFRTFRRILNPAMVAGLGILVGSALLFAVKTGSTMSELRSAKEDAFDSVHALSQAKAEAYAANAYESMYLLLQGRDGQMEQTRLFRKTADRMFSATLLPGDRLPADLKPLQGHGLLANELANVTFEGEEPLAKEALARWLEYLHIDGQIRELEIGGRHGEAVALCLGTQPHQSDWAFEQLIKALDATLKLNEEQFDAAIGRAFAQVNVLLYLLAPLLLAPLLGSVAGLMPRLAEFRA